MIELPGAAVICVFIGGLLSKFRRLNIPIDLATM